MAQLNARCDARFGKHAPTPDTRPRPYDIPWVVMDSSDAERVFGWRVGFRSPNTPSAIRIGWKEAGSKAALTQLRRHEALEPIPGLGLNPTC